MRGTRWAIGLVAVLAGAAGLTHAADDTTYDLRGPAPKVGQTTLNKTTFKIKEATVTVKLMGQSFDASQTETATDTEETKVLAVDGRQVTRAQIKVVRQRVEAVGSVLGMGVTEKKTLPLEGETIVAERAGAGKWKHSLIDNKPDDKQQRQLGRRVGVESEDSFLPAEKVKVGYTATVPATALRRVFGESLSDVDGKLKLTFARVEKVGDDDCAVLELAGTAKGVARQDEGDLDAEVTLKLTTWRSLKTGVPVKDHAEGKLKMSGKLDAAGMKVDVAIDGPFTLDATTELK